MKKAGPYILIVLLAAALFFLKNYKGHTPSTDRKKDKSEVKKKDRETKHNNSDNGFDRSVAFLEYTQHARCRMGCRKIDAAEVEDIMKNGEVNYRKSFAKGKPCPTYALEGYTRQDNQHVRIVFAQCDTKTKVVTCIDLDNEFTCHCPGDENK